MNCGPPPSSFLDLNWDQPITNLSSPPFAADPEFVRRAARFSCFGGGGGGGGGLNCRNYEQMGVREDSDPISAGESSGRKRRSAPKGKGKDTPKMEENFDAKRCRSGESGKTEEDEVKPKIERNSAASSSGGEGKENNVKAPEPQKDYIHVRARRGQATDSHSLAERVRREKISERMKLLQDLVPGCNKVTGKALMLDEIINYVQSLQKQVEFLSMKLATVNPRLDFNVDGLIPKDMHQSSGSLPQSVNSMEASAAGFQFTHQPLESQFLMNALEPALHRTLGMQLQSLEGFGEAASQLESFWENDLHNVVHMGFGQGQESVFASQGFHDQLPTDHMKIEL